MSTSIIPIPVTSPVHEARRALQAAADQFDQAVANLDAAEAAADQADADLIAAHRVYSAALSHGYEAAAPISYSYKARDASGFRIEREHLPADELVNQWGNLIVSGYIIEVVNDLTGEIVPQDNILGLDERVAA